MIDMIPRAIGRYIPLWDIGEKIRMWVLEAGCGFRGCASTGQEHMAELPLDGRWYQALGI